MSRYIGNYLRVPSLEPQQSSAPGIWSLSEQLAYQRANVWPPARDPYYNQTVLHLSGDVAGTRETNPVTQPRTFLSDASTNNFLLTPYGDVSARPFNPYLSNYSNYFSGSVDGLTLAYNAAFLLDTNFTLEGWIFPIASANQCIIGMLDSGGVANWDLYVLAANTVRIRWLNTSATIYSVTSAAIALNQWTHVAVTLSGTTLALYVNGVLAGTTTVTGSARNTSRPIGIGRPGDYAGEYFAGYLSNIRYVRGSVVYTGAFTPSTTPLTAISNTALLTCQSNRFKDNSTNNFNITVTGSPRVTDNSPFVSYDTTNGSGYFDGTTDYLTAPASNIVDFAAGQAFTFECWVYVSSIATSQAITASGANTLSLAISGGQILYGKSGVIDLLVGTMAPANQWVHVAVGRNSSNTSRLWVNGTSVATSSSDTYSYNVATMYIGSNSSPASYLNGYISNLRVIKGTDVYGVGNTNISVPTAPLQAVSGTSLLTLQTRAPANNQGILDTSPNRFVVTRNGNVAQGSFSPFSQSGWSNYFPGTARINIASSTAFSFGTGDFTVEGWIFTNSSTMNMFDARSAATATPWVLNVGTGSNTYWYDGTSYTSSIGITLGQWNHVAVTRVSGVLKIFVNGQQGYSANHNVNQDRSAGLIIGDVVQTGYNWVGYLSNLRIVKGQALYTGAFTPPTGVMSASSVGTSGTNVVTSITSPVSLLTAQSNRFVDNSTNNFALTLTNSPSIQPFSPFAPTQAYVASQLGGSAYFDGNDYLSFAVNQAPLVLGNSDFTVEAWVYRLNTNTAVVLAGQSDLATGAGSAYVFYVSSSSTSDLYSASGYSVTSPNPGINQWAHVAWARTGGTYSSYLNGVRVGNRTDLGTATVNTGSTTYAPSVGSFTSGSSSLTGYISGLRFIKGSGGYNANDTNIVIPTAPPISTQNTSLLLNFTGAGIVDSTGKNVVETVDNNAVQTKIIQYGTGSMYFDGSGDYLKIQPGTFKFGTSNFTVETWLYPTTSMAGEGDIIGFNFNSNLSSFASFRLIVANSQLKYVIGTSGTSWAHTVTTGSIPVNTWTHLAFVRNGSTFTPYINGIAGTTATNSSALYEGTAGSLVGAVLVNPVSSFFNGYMKEIRVTIGLARYSGSNTSAANFTPPTGPFPLA